jgi:uncharacterized protein (DUF885 family)
MPALRRILFAILFLTLLSATFAQTAAKRSTPAKKVDAGITLHALFDSEWEYGLEQNPLFASTLGDRRWNDQLGDVSLASAAKDLAHTQAAIQKLAAIDRAALTPADQLNYDLFKHGLEDNLQEHKFRTYLLAVDEQNGGVHTLDTLTELLRFSTAKDFQDWTARLNAYPLMVDQTIEVLREGMRTGIMPSRLTMARIPTQIGKRIVSDATLSDYYAPFKNLPKSISEAEQKQLAEAGRVAVETKVIPALRKFDKFFTGEYLPKCYPDAGIWQRPDGDAYYQFAVRKHTTTNMTPEEIHQLGLKEVARIRSEMDAIKDKTGFKGSMQEFFKFLRTDPQFFYKTGEELLEASRANAKRIDPLLVKEFKKLPRMPYGVTPIPMSIAPDQTTAYYQQGAEDGSRAGMYNVNLYKPETRPKWEMMALTMHEAVPGHHLQIALALEMGELPKFRRYGNYTAFIEGWGLYSESLGDEMGLYDNPYSKFGQLTYEMWRAVRLVVDTGMHYKHWTRQQAIDYFMANAAKTELDVTNEIDRYIGWPGQALAYKIGELKIKELRAKAKQEFAERFDVRDFHDVVLGSGPLPLDILEKNVNAWIAANCPKACELPPGLTHPANHPTPVRPAATRQGNKPKR